MSMDFENSSSERVSIGSGYAGVADVASATLMCWCIPESVGTVVMLGIENDSNSNIRSILIQVDDAPDFWQAGGRRLNDAFIAAEGGTVTVDSLTHIAGVYEYTNQSLKLYVNGALADTQSPAGWTANSAAATADDAFIGANWNGTSSFDGRIQDVRVYQRTLSADEIAVIYQSRGHDSIVDGLVNRWLLTEGYPGQSASVASSVRDIGLDAVNASPENTPTWDEFLIAPRRRAA